MKQPLQWDELSKEAKTQAYNNFIAEELYDGYYIGNTPVTDNISYADFERYLADNYWYVADGGIIEKK